MFRISWDRCSSITASGRSAGFALRVIRKTWKSPINIAASSAGRDRRANRRRQIELQMRDNIHWIREAGKNKLVVGSQARILYADCEGQDKDRRSLQRGHP